MHWSTGVVGSCSCSGRGGARVPCTSWRPTSCAGVGLGPTLLISPLLALIRNQIDAASRLGLRTLTVNSSSATSVRELADALAADEVDLVLVSPERLANPEFADKVMPLVGRRPG